MKQVNLKSGTMSKPEAADMMRMLQGFKEQPGYRWLMDRMTESFDAVQGTLDNTIGVGEGAWKIAQAQGQKISLRQALTITDGTINALDAFIKSNEAPETEEENA